MTFPDSSLERPLEPRGVSRENVQDEPAGERVYAPASERVPVNPVPGHRNFVEHPDTHTPEREAVGQKATTSTTTTMNDNSNTEPSFTRVARPSTTPTPSGGVYGSSTWSAGFQGDQYADRSTNRRRVMFFGIGFSWFTVICSAVGVWLFMRWRHERNKPINRLRRQAKQAAVELRGRVPRREEAARPAMGLTTAIVSILLLVWQQAQARSRKTEKVVTDVDWQKRLLKLKERWTPGRVELEKIAISRH